MTEKHRTIVVVLDSEYEPDELDPLLSAIGLLEGVQDVALSPPVTAGLMANQILVRNRMALLMEQAALDMMNASLDGEDDE